MGHREKIFLTLKNSPVKSGGATNVEGEYIVSVSKIPCSCRKCRDSTLDNLVCPASDFSDKKEYRMKRIVVEGELEEEVIDLEVGQVEDEEVEEVDVE